MDIRFTLQAEYAGAQFVAGPFNLYGYTAAAPSTPILLSPTPVSKAQLLAGHVVSTASNIVGGTIQSTGTCSTTPPEAYTLQFSSGPVIIGSFNNYGTNSDVGIVKLTNTLGLDSTFNVGSGFGIDSYLDETGPMSIAKVSNGKIVVGGVFTSYDGVSTYGIVRLNPDGSRDYTFSGVGTYFNGRIILSVDVQSDGKIIVGGCNSTNLTSISDGAGMLIRLNLNGSQDTTFIPSSTLLYGTVRVVRVLPQDNDNILVAGNNFGLMKFSPIGNYLWGDTSVMPINTGDGLGPFSCLDLDRSGRIMIGGLWNSIFGNAAFGGNGPVRINAAGVFDNSWLPKCNGRVTSMVESNATANEVVIVGTFTAVNLQTRNGIVTVNTNGTAVGTFNTTATYDTSIDPVNTWFPGSRISVLSNGNLLWMGKMNSVNSQPAYKNIVVLNPSNGTLITTPTGLSNLAIYRGSANF